MEAVAGEVFMNAMAESAIVPVQARDEDGVWARIARSYAAFGSPFVPCGEDIAAFECALAAHADSSGTEPLKAVILGVTPALALMNWPQRSHVVAVEISPAVISALWPGDVPGSRRAICASWAAIPMAQRSCDVVVGDGSLSTCRFPGEVRSVVRSVSRLLASGGRFIFRTYIRAEAGESVDAVFDALFSTKGMSVDCFKMRLYLAIQRSPEEGVAVSEAARVLDAYQLDAQVMKERLGWSNEAIQPFAAWRSSSAVYSFPALKGIRELLSEDFDEVSIEFPEYELGICCPTIALRKR